MNNLYKFINEYTIEKWDKKYVVLDGKQISYPSEETFLNSGIKPLVEEDIPEYNYETQYIIEYYEDTTDSIVKHYKIEEIPPTEEVIYDESITDA